jgi:hypothetical protein
MLPSDPVSPHRISAANGQNKVNEARPPATSDRDEHCYKLKRLQIDRKPQEPIRVARSSPATSMT